MFEIVHYLYELIRDTKTFVDEASGSLQPRGADDLAALHRIYKRIFWIAATVTVVGFVVVPCSAPWLAVWLHDITASDALFRMFLGMILSLGLVWFYLFAGAALGCLTAPSSFLCGPAGRKWMKLLGGTRNLPTHRVVCVLGALLGFGIMAGVAVLLIYMHPTIT